jgi:hypothetical protein
VRITFSEGLDGTRAEQARNYRLNLGLNGDLGPIPIAGASYDDADHTVSLLLRRPIASNASFRLTVISRPPAGLTNRRGLALDGNNDGSPGGNFIGVFQEGGLRRGPGMDSPTGGRPAPVSPGAVDSIFGTGGLRVARRRP